MPHFETFHKDQTPLTKEPQVTVQKRGTITFNAAAYGLLGSPAAVELLYDPDERLLGLRAVSARAPHAMFVRSSSRTANGPWVVSAMAFVHHYGIDTTYSRRWVARLAGDTLIVPVGEDGKIVSRAQRVRESVGDATTRRRPRPRPA